MKTRKILNSKSSQGHVEMIVSFAIFLGFVVTLFLILNPTKSKQISYTLLDITEEAVLENWVINYTTASLAVRDSTTGDCVSVLNLLSGFNTNILAKNMAGIVKQSSTGANLVVEHNPSNPSDDYYTLYISNVFNSGASPACPSGTYSAIDYSFGARNYHKAISLQKIIDFQEAYNNSYADLKAELNLNNDFMFFVYDSSGSTLYSGEMFVPRYTEVVAREFPLIVIDSNANLHNMKLNLRAW